MSDIVVTAIYVYDVTGSAGLVGVMSFLRFMPMIAGAFSGALAARFTLHLLLRGLLAMLALVYATMAVLAFSGRLAMWQVAAGALLIGCYWSAENSVRRTLVGEVVGTERISTAIGLDWATINALRLVGPLIGAALYSGWGLGAWYALCALAFAAATGLSVEVRSAIEPAAARTRYIFTAMAEDIAAALRNPAIAGMLAVTLSMNFFHFPYTSMVPVIGKQVLGASPVEVGMLTSADSVGALIGGFAVASVAQPRLFGRIFVIGSAAATLGVFGLGVSRDYALTMAALFLTGVGGALFGTMQSTLMLTRAPPERRAQMMGVLTTCIGLGQVGTLAVGAVAERIGAGAGVALFGALAFLAVMLCAWTKPALWRSTAG